MIYQLFHTIVLIISLPFMVLIAMLILFFSGFPIIFSQKRIGKGGKPFTMYKFRTMVLNAEELKDKYAKRNEASGPAFKMHNDPRFTPIGRFFSHTGLDELPQLFNVLLGDMALIGPRPLPVEEAQQLQFWQQKRQDILPGIISPWILDGYHRQTFDAWMKSDIAYIHQKSLFYDIKLFFSSIWFMVRLIYRECCK
jgi:lipopolysaccharide/colanic/teichoic acid biosynthesis glycosyltransferase